jgi:hypothetical protein
MQKAVNTVFLQLSASLDQLTQDQFVRPCRNLFNNTIGQHVRHIIEMFQCLETGYHTGMVDYEKRKRDREIENGKEYATRLLKEIYEGLHKDNRQLGLATYYEELATEPVVLSTNYNRELAYNLEHTIHHMALIRVGIAEVSDIPLSEEYGVAASTIKHRRQCAQ